MPTGGWPAFYARAAAAHDRAASVHLQAARLLSRHRDVAGSAAEHRAAARELARSHLDRLHASTTSPTAATDGESGRWRSALASSPWRPCGSGGWVSFRTTPQEHRVCLAGRVDRQVVALLDIFVDLAPQRSAPIVIDLGAVTDLDEPAAAQLERFDPHGNATLTGGPWPAPPVGGAGCDRAAGPSTPGFLHHGYGGRVEVLSQALDDAIAAGRGDMADGQLVDHRSQALHLVVVRGFAQRFVDFFAVVDGAGTVCAEAVAQRRVTANRDVLRSPTFAGQPSLHVLLDAGARAVISIPIIVSGQPVAVISLHSRHARIWTPEQRLALRQVASTTAHEMASIA